MAKRGQRLTLEERLRYRLRDWFKPRGLAAAVSKYITESPVSNKPLTPQQISMFIHGERGLDIDSLEDLAIALRLPGGIPDLLGVPNKTGLNGREQRLILAFQAVSEPVQEHVLGLLEPLSVASRVEADRSSRLRAADASLIKHTADARLDAPRPPHSSQAAADIATATTRLADAIDLASQTSRTHRVAPHREQDATPHPRSAKGGKSTAGRSRKPV